MLFYPDFLGYLMNRNMVMMNDRGISNKNRNISQSSRNFGRVNSLVEVEHKILPTGRARRSSR